MATPLSDRRMAELVWFLLCFGGPYERDFKGLGRIGVSLSIDCRNIKSKSKEGLHRKTLGKTQNNQ